MITIAFLAYMTLVLIPINWKLEMRADAAAARFAGKDNIKSALLSIAKQDGLEVQSETHPSVMERIRGLEGSER